MLKNAKPYTERLFDYRTIGELPRATAATALTVPAQRVSAAFENAGLSWPHCDGGKASQRRNG
jgi:hypothetical protein